LISLPHDLNGIVLIVLDHDRGTQFGAINSFAKLPPAIVMQLADVSRDSDSSALMRIASNPSPSYNMVGKFLSIARKIVERTEVCDEPDFAHPAIRVDDGSKCVVGITPQMLRTSQPPGLAVDVFFFLDIVYSSGLHERDARGVVACSEGVPRGGYVGTGVCSCVPDCVSLVPRADVETENDFEAKLDSVGLVYEVARCSQFFQAGNEAVMVAAVGS
jgi:hypothetical protein